MGLNNRGLPGKSLNDIPAGENYDGLPQKYTGSTYSVPRYAGNDVHGISLAVCRNCAVVDCDVSECSSDNGNVYGILMRNMADANQVNGAVVTNLRALRDDVASAINPSSVVYGMVVDGNCHANSVQGISVHRLSAPRFVYGFYAHNATDTQLSDAQISHLTVSADPSTTLKQVAAYATIGCYATRIENSSARVISVYNEANTTQDSGSIAAGFIIGDAQSGKDIYTVLENNSVECIAGGAGIAAGLLIQNGEQCTITDNNFAYAVAGGKTKRGYGIFNRMGANLSGLIIRNSAYGNSLKQYDFASARYPVLTINPQTTAAMRDTAWYNVAYQ
jgi:hypothetical protein